MGPPEPKSSSRAGSLTTSFSEKLKVASAKAGRGDHKDLDIAIIKATTSQFHVVPKEKHVRTLKLAVHSSRPRRDVTHIISELHNRLQDSSDWLTALKTLITLHRLMRETEPSFMEELVRYSKGQAHTQGHGGGGAAPAAVPPGRLFNMENFIDRTQADGRFDFSEWVRGYGKYLDEQLSVYARLTWYVEQEAPGSPSRMRTLGARDLLFQLPHLQRLQRRLLDCVPRGAAMHDPVVLFSLTLVVKESFKSYKAVSEGIINLADAFFEMEYHDATKGLELYKEGMGSSDALSGYYATIEQIDEIKRSMQLPKLSTPPADFLTSMEAYLEEAPRAAPAEGEAHVPTKKGAPLRKGKMMQSSSVRRADSGPSVALAGAPRDPGMVLPVTAAVQESASGSATVSSPTAAAAAAAGQSPKSPVVAASPTAAAAPAVAGVVSQKAAPTPLDLLSGLDFSFGDVEGPPAAPVSSNPFADVPLAPAAALGPAPPPAAGGSSNPFGDPMPSPGASGAFDGTSILEWSRPPAAMAQPPQVQVQQPVWGAAPQQAQPQQYGMQQQQQSQQPQVQQQLGHYGMSLPSPAAGGAHAGFTSDDPFANYGAPSPSPSTAPSAYGGGGAQLRASGAGAFWASPPTAASGPYGAGPGVRPAGTAGDEMSKAALHDPFAALTGLPLKTSPGAGGNKPSPPRAGLYPGAPSYF